MPRKVDEPVRLTRIYTRGGDKGETSLGDGSRASKLDCRIGAFGTVDELNAAIGVVLAGDLENEARPVLERVQNELFDVGADLSVPYGVGDGRLRVTQEQIDALEQDCDRFNADLPELKSFVLPGGTESAARLHVARTVCRRAERDTLTASKEVELQPARPRLPEPPVRPALHPRARRERRPRGDPLEAGREPVSRLARRLGTADAVVIGLGAMLGAGVFAAFGPAAEAAGSGILLALALAAFVAFCNATSSAELAAIYPQAGGTLRVRPGAARPLLRLSGRMGLRGRKGRKLRGDGDHLRRVRRSGRAEARRSRGGRRADRGSTRRESTAPPR